MIFRNLTYSQ